jgi:GNAT superfamily N-acetyltransferase
MSGEGVVCLVTRAGDEIEVGPLRPDEHGALFALFDSVVATGEGFPQAPPLTYQVFDATWVGGVTVTVVARRRGEVAGAYYLKPNFAPRAGHIANAGYVVATGHRHRGIGRALIEDSIRRAPLAGFDAIQFNLVFESNPARALYEELGWREIGRVPKAVDGEDAVIYWREVGSSDG